MNKAFSAALILGLTCLIRLLPRFFFAGDTFFSRRRCSRIFTMPDGPEFLSALEEHLLTKQLTGIGMLSAEEEEFLRFRAETAGEEDPVLRAENDRRIIAYVRNFEQHFS